MIYFKDGEPVMGNAKATGKKNPLYDTRPEEEQLLSNLQSTVKGMTRKAQNVQSSYIDSVSFNQRIVNGVANLGVCLPTTPAQFVFGHTNNISDVERGLDPTNTNNSYIYRYSFGWHNIYAGSPGYVPASDPGSNFSVPVYFSLLFIDYMSITSPSYPSLQNEVLISENIGTLSFNRSGWGVIGYGTFTFTPSEGASLPQRALTKSINLQDTITERINNDFTSNNDQITSTQFEKYKRGEYKTLSSTACCDVTGLTVAQSNFLAQIAVGLNSGGQYIGPMWEWNYTVTFETQGTKSST